MRGAHRRVLGVAHPRRREDQGTDTRKDGRPLLVAGLWNCVQTPNGPLESCTLVTRPPTPDLVDVHDRMPALLLNKDVGTWLDAPSNVARAAALTSWSPRILAVTPA